jgi:hypothetical protein
LAIPGIRQALESEVFPTGSLVERGGDVVIIDTA